MRAGSIGKPDEVACCTKSASLMQVSDSGIHRVGLKNLFGKSSFAVQSGFRLLSLRPRVTER